MANQTPWRRSNNALINRENLQITLLNKYYRMVNPKIKNRNLKNDA